MSGTVERVHQIAIVPVYGHRKHNEDDDIESTPIAIMQLINKTSLKQIETYDLVSVKSVI